MPGIIDVVHHSDPGCPWAYSASPAHALLRWRFGDQLAWRLVLIGLTESAERYVERGYTPVLMAQGYPRFRRWGMPFGGQPKARMTATGRACRTVVAARVLDPALELPVFRALQLAQFTSTALLDTDEGLLQALARLGDAVDGPALVAATTRADVEAAYQADRAEARTAEGGPTHAQGKSANSDGAERFTAPSLLFTTPDGRTLEAGGFQSPEAYDVCLANLDPTLTRRAPATDPLEVLAILPFPATTREVSICMAPSLTEPDDHAVEALLIEAAGAGAVRRESVGDGALWHLTAV
jgi:protein-disulfide isomerase-like protein with CxxC motif